MDFYMNRMDYHVEYPVNNPNGLGYISRKSETAEKWSILIHFIPKGKNGELRQDFKHLKSLLASTLFKDSGGIYPHVLMIICMLRV